MGSKINPAEEVTNRILDLMDEHGTDWIKPFASTRRPQVIGGNSGTLPLSISTGREYRGINTVLLWTMPYSDRRWGTYKAWKRGGAQVRKGEASTIVVFWKIIESKTEPGKKFPILRYYRVFNAEQVDGAENVMPPAEFTGEVIPGDEDTTDRLAEVDAFVSALGATIHHDDRGRAFYAPTLDEITMPERASFRATETSTATENYYSTLLHELTHWTGHASRLDRLKGGRFGSPEYAFEELVAEFGAAIACGSLGISAEPRPDHAKYLNNWKKALRSEPGLVISAAGKAAKAFAWMEEKAGRQVEDVASSAAYEAA